MVNNQNVIKEVTKYIEIPVNPKTQTKTINITTNGDYTISPDIGYLLQSVIAKVNISGVALVGNATIRNSTATCPGSSKYINCAIFPISVNGSRLLEYRTISALNTTFICSRNNPSTMYTESRSGTRSGDKLTSDYSWCEDYRYMFIA